MWFFSGYFFNGVALGCALFGIFVYFAEATTVDMWHRIALCNILAYIFRCIGAVMLRHK